MKSFQPPERAYSPGAGALLDADGPLSCANAGQGHPPLRFSPIQRTVPSTSHPRAHAAENRSEALGSIQGAPASRIISPPLSWLQERVRIGCRQPPPLPRTGIFPGAASSPACTPSISKGSRVPAHLPEQAPDATTPPRRATDVGLCCTLFHAASWAPGPRGARNARDNHENNIGCSTLS